MADETLTLIPTLPNDLSALILSFVPFPFHVRLKATCKSWRCFYSSKLPLSLRLTHLPTSELSHLLCLFPDDPSLSSPFLFDTTHLCWAPLPPMPINPYVYSLSNFAAISIGPSIFVLGGSLFDTRSYPMDRPVASVAAFRYDLDVGLWLPIAPMITPRGSHAAAVVEKGRRIVVAGGGSRHAMFGAAGSQVGFAEVYDVENDEWAPLADLPGSRAGCVGFCVGGEREFWVMGGYGEARTINGVLPVDEHYKDVVVLELESEKGGIVGQGRWREIGHMWEDQERARLGKVVVIDDDDDQHAGKNLPNVFMLDENDIFRYNMASNRWLKESAVPRKAQNGSPFGFVAIRGELHVMYLLQGVELSAIRRSRHRRRGTVLLMQIYNPKNMSWRSLVTRTPFQCPIDFKTVVTCTVRV